MARWHLYAGATPPATVAWLERVSGEHGVRVEESRSSNPGKVVPRLHRCAELGRMHIHRGQLAFPDLPRF